jgi:hypothetical protein
MIQRWHWLNKTLVYQLIVFLLLPIFIGLAINLVYAQENIPLLDILGIDELSITYNKPDEEPNIKILTIRNNMPDKLTLNFCVIVKPGDKFCDDSQSEEETSNAGITVDPFEDTIEGFEVKQFNITLTIPSPEKESVFDGYLIIRPKTDIATVALPLKLSPFQPDSVDILGEVIQISVVSLLMFFSFLVTLVAFIFLAVTQDLSSENVPKTLAWGAKESWATTLTTVGAILGIFIGGNILPDKTQVLDETTFQTLNLLFLMLITIAPFVYKALPKRIWSLVLASGITTFAVLGEVGTIFLFLAELPIPTISGFKLIIAVIWVFVLVYSLNGTIGIITAEKKAEDKRVKRMGKMKSACTRVAEREQELVDLKNSKEEEVDKIHNIMKGLVGDVTDILKFSEDPGLRPIVWLVEGMEHIIFTANETSTKKIELRMQAEILVAELKTSLEHAEILLGKDEKPLDLVLIHIAEHMDGASVRAFGNTAPLMGTIDAEPEHQATLL